MVLVLRWGGIGVVFVVSVWYWYGDCMALVWYRLVFSGQLYLYGVGTGLAGERNCIDMAFASRRCGIGAVALRYWNGLGAVWYGRRICIVFI